MGRKRSVRSLVYMITCLSLIACTPRTSRISIHDRFLKSSDGIITDIVTGYNWIVGPDRDFDRYSAEIWIEDLGGGWRMPTRDELEELYDAGITTETWGAFDNAGWLVWCVDYSSPGMTYRFCFIPNNVFSELYPSSPAGQRVFAVLSPMDYGTVALL